MRKLFGAVAVVFFGCLMAMPSARAQSCDGIAHLSLDRNGKELRVQVSTQLSSPITAMVVWGNFPAGSSHPNGRRTVEIQGRNSLSVSLGTIPDSLRTSNVGRFVDFNVPSYKLPYVTLNNCKR